MKGHGAQKWTIVRKQGFSSSFTHPQEQAVYGPDTDGEIEVVSASLPEEIAGELEAEADARMKPDSNSLGEAVVRAAEAGALREAAKLLRSKLSDPEEGHESTSG